MYRYGPRTDAYLGVVVAPSGGKALALALAEKQWPEHAGSLHVACEAFVRRMLVQVNAKIERNPHAYAFHEAGHVAAARRFGWPIEWVTIRPELYSSGGQFHPGVDSFGRVLLGRCFFDLELPSHQEEAEEYIQFGLAGPTAEFRFRGRSRWPRQSDVAAIDDLLRAHAREGEEDEYLQNQKVRAAALVNEVWPEIEAVAAVLVERREMSGAELKRIVRTRSFGSRKARSRKQNSR